jgi:hypothetical protein
MTENKAPPPVIKGTVYMVSSDGDEWALPLAHVVKEPFFSEFFDGAEDGTKEHIPISSHVLRPLARVIQFGGTPGEHLPPVGQPLPAGTRLQVHLQMARHPENSTAEEVSQNNISNFVYHLPDAELVNLIYQANKHFMVGLTRLALADMALRIRDRQNETGRGQAELMRELLGVREMTADEEKYVRREFDERVFGRVPAAVAGV